MKKCAILLALAACGSGGDERLVAVRDPLVLYSDDGRAVVPISRVHGADSLAVERLTKRRLSSDSAVRFDGSGLSCRGPGSATLEVWAGKLSTSLTVECRPAYHFISIPFPWMRVGDPPIPLTIVAVLKSGAVDTVRPVAFRVADTSVIQIHDGELIARGAGRSRFWADVGGRELVNQAAVAEAVAEVTLSLAPGEQRRWPLDSGLYEIRVTAAESPSRGAWPELTTEGAKCSPRRGQEDTVNCFVRRAGAVELSSGVRAEQLRSRAITLSILKLP